MIYGGLFELDSKIVKRDELNAMINDVNFWNRSDKDDILKEYNTLVNLIDSVEKVKSKIDSNLLLLNDSLDSELLSLINDEYNDIRNQVDKLRIDTYLSGEFDKNDCFLEIHSGAGGTEANDWANMLYRMYTRYLTKNGYKYTEIDKQLGEEVGIKSVMIEVNGNNSYGYLKGEIGVHRLVRISPFDANKRRHTSFASVLVTPKAILELIFLEVVAQVVRVLIRLIQLLELHIYQQGLLLPVKMREVKLEIVKLL